MDDSADTGITVNIELTLSMAAAATGPVPVMMQFGFNFPPGFLPDSAAPMHPLARTLRRRAITRRPGSSRCLRGAEGYAVLIPNRVQDENSAGLTTDFIGLCNRRQRHKPDDWGALRAWAWGASHARDYFETDKAVDVVRRAPSLSPAAQRRATAGWMPKGCSWPPPGRYTGCWENTIWAPQISRRWARH